MTYNEELPLELDFYQNLVPFENFDEMTQRQHYRSAPPSWIVVITDVKGSTQHIKSGRYKEVNLLGAATITAALNACQPTPIPFVFGGDGATLLIPPSLKVAVEKALYSTKILAQQRFGIELRIGLVTIAELVATGAVFEVSKFQLSPHNFLSMFRGDGVALAEKIVKSRPQEPGPVVQLNNSNLDGLSCRWNILANKNGMILSLLISVRNEVPHKDELYESILSRLQQILGPNVHPVSVEQLNPDSFWKTIFREAKLKHKSKGPLTLIKLFFLMGIIYFLSRFKIKVGGFDMKKYLNEIPINSDYRKFDGMIRMIVDCSTMQSDEIKTWLEKLYDQKQIYFGMQHSASALMTCFVKSLNENKHLHFIDGSDGGYAMAAAQLKQQMLAAV